MFYKNFNRVCTLSAIATVLKISTFSAFVTEANAQIFEPPKRHPAPTSTIGGGRRSGDAQCLNDKIFQPNNAENTNKSPEQQLTLLLPPNKFGLTILPNPQFFAYIPKTSAIAVEFILENPQGKGIAQKRIPLTSTPTIVSAKFDNAPLEVGKDYKWLISVVCETGDPEDNFSEGIVRRIAPERTLISQLEKASGIEQVSLYERSGIWHEAIAGLINMRLSQPNRAEIKNGWINLLKSSSLEFLANVPIKTFVVSSTNH
ncbi:DUF928 domain-containing protein [Pseudanabaena biceps]|nr:DUF928 domain-containing protein [Pseudanabaena biceps]